MATDLTGQTLGQYQLKEAVGQGGLATVYKAYQANLERWVAVKVLYVEDKTTLTRFKREARATAHLRHPNILMVYEYSEHAGWPYIVMELVEGGTLTDYLHGEPLTWPHVVNVTTSIARALQYAHQQKLIHRDVKPSNILMPQANWPLLADFGLVKMAQGGYTLTATGMVMGTPAYIPPEQVRGQEIDHRADMYSLGVIIFEMITGRLPFTHPIANALMLAHIIETPPAPRDLNPKCPEALEKIILKAMEKSPDDRYPDMQAMIDALDKIAERSTMPMPVFPESR